MKKFLKRVLLLIVIIVLENNYSLCMAAEHKVESDINIYNTVYSSSQYAYSVGSIWKTPHHYDDNFRTNVYNAANKYSQISGISSYYNTEADYTYMRGNNPKGQRRIGSYIFFINGHANPISILSASSDTAKNRTGITVGYDSTVSEDGEFTVAGLQSTNMSGSRLILFVGCSTGAWPNTSENPYSTNLPIRAVERGANAALGFRKLISSRFGDGPNWLNAFNQAIVNGYTIDGANAYACTQYPNSDLSKCSMAEGDINSRVVPVTRYASMSEKKYENEYKSLVVPEQDIEIIIDEKNSDDEKALSKCENKYKEIIETIKTQDDDFNIDVVIAEITAFAENMHAKNQHKKKVCLRCMMIIPLVFMVLMFTMDTAKVVYLLLWVISLFIFCAYLIVIDYIDDKLARKLNELNIEIKEKQADTSLTDSIKAFLSEVQL